MRLSAFDPSRRHLTIVLGGLVSAIILGGGGSPNPGTELGLQMLCVLASFAWFWLPGPLRLPKGGWIWLLAGTILLVPLLQLMPLPPTVWSSLPGREAERAALALIGEEHSWRPLSISPSRTLASLLSLGPPLLLMLAVAALTARERKTVIGMIAIMAIISALLGAMQLAAGATKLNLYAYTTPSVVTGFQAYRNAEADILLIGLLALAVSAVASRRERRGTASASRLYWVGAAALLIILATILTASRGGIVLLAPALVTAWAIYAIGRQRPWHRQFLAGIAAFGVVATSAVLLVQHNTAVQKVAARFEAEEVGRPALWRDTLYAIEQVWPVGSGVGSFVPVFIAQEPLEAVDPSSPNRAHNDYLELALEAGLTGIVVLVLGTGLVLVMAASAWRYRPEDRSQLLFALAALGVIAAHSLVDYPLRSMSLACLAAIAAGILAPPREAGTKSNGGASDPYADRAITPILARILPSIILAFYAFAAMGSGLDRISREVPPLERLVPVPFRASADRNAAAMALVRGETARALEYARAAVSADPAEPLAASLLGAARQMSGDPAGSEAAFRVAALGGWRDRLTQLYWYGVALDAGDVQNAALRVDAALRVEPNFVAADDLLRPLEASTAGREQLARRLAERPSWAGRFLSPGNESDANLLRARAAIAAAVPRHGQPLGCDLPRGLTLQLLSSGMRREARTVWAANCQTYHPLSGIADAGFEELSASGAASPFGWNRGAGGDVEVRVVSLASGNKAIEVRNDSSVTRRILWQAVELSPGTYRVRASILSGDAPARGRVAASLDCDGNSRRPVAPVGDPAAEGQRFTIGLCERPVLAFWLRPGGSAVTMDNVMIERIE